MADRVFATLTDYVNITGDTDTDGLEYRLRRASERVETLTVTAIYPVDADGMPTTEPAISALRKATCYQAQWMAAIGDDTGAAGMWSSIGIGSVNLSGSKTSGSSGQGSLYAPEAVAVLAAAGMVNGEPQG